MVVEGGWKTLKTKEQNTIWSQGTKWQTSKVNVIQYLKCIIKSFMLFNLGTLKPFMVHSGPERGSG